MGDEESRLVGVKDMDVSRPPAEANVYVSLWP